MYIMSTMSTSATLYTGRVKWFNNKAGYGFITIVSTPEASEVEKNTDVFTHHSSIQVKDEQYKYLVQGEYVQFSLTIVEDGEHKHQAQSVSGIGGGQLLCETRNTVRSNALQRTPSRVIKTTSDNRPARSSSNNGPQSRGSGPRDDEEWVLTRRTTNTQRSGNRSGNRSANRSEQSSTR